MAVEIYTNIADLPLDEWDGNDGDNSILANGPVTSVDLDTEGLVSNEIRSLLSATSASSAVAYVPFKRTLKQGMAGPDVRAVHRALRVARGESPGSPTRVFGPYMKKRLIAFQKSKRLTADGVYGLATHRALAPYFDNYGRWLLGQTKLLSTADLKRQKIVSTAMHGYNNRYGIHYTQSGLRMQGVRQKIRPPAYPRYEDCSSFATWCYWVAGVSDPNGLGYSGYGYTGTLARHGVRISTAQMKPGDLIFYGWFPHNHVTIYVGNGRCVSHGSESGPVLLPYNYRTVNSVRRYL